MTLYLTSAAKNYAVRLQFLNVAKKLENLQAAANSFV
jgi:hypothetical protein